MTDLEFKEYMVEARDTTMYGPYEANDPLGAIRAMYHDVQGEDSGPLTPTWSGGNWTWAVYDSEGEAYYYVEPKPKDE